MTTQLPPDPATLVADWITVWQSELSAMATDRELAESWRRGLALWADAARAAAAMLPGPHERPGGRAGAAAPAGSAAAVAAPDGRDARLEQLAARVAELERRLAELGAPAS